MKKVDALVRGGILVTEAWTAPGMIAIQHGRIAGILSPDEEMDADEVIDAKGCVVMPGLIDSHVHLWEPGPLSYREDYSTGTRAAAAGGVTTIIEMPLSIPPVIDRTSLEHKLSVAKSKAVVDFSLWGGLTPSAIENVQELHELGCTGFKAFMSYANDDYPHTPDHLLFEGMRRVAQFDGLVGVHAENADIVAYTSRQLQELGRTDSEAHADSRPKFAELEAIQRAILFAEHANCRLHIVHMTIPEGAEVIRRAKERGVRVTVETCPQYLVLDRSELARRGGAVKCNPPLRDRDNVERLWQQVLLDRVDTIASDHGPYSDEDKAKGDSIWDIPPGFGGLETMLPLLIDEGVHKRGLRLEALSRMTSSNVARIFGLFPKKGSLMAGADADLTIVDLHRDWTIRGMDSFSKAKSANSPFEGRNVRGKVIATLVRGKVVYREGQIQTEPGFGQYVPLHWRGSQS